MSDQPAYLLFFRPKGRTVLRDFFNTYGAIYDLMLRPPETRYASFGLRIAATPQLREGEFWEVKGQELLSGRTRQLRVYVDGSVIFRASADASFLCWPRDQADRVVNPIVVADSIVSFCRFVEALLRLATVRPDRSVIGTEIRNASASQPPLMMYAGRLRKDIERFTLLPADLRGVGEVHPRRDVSMPTKALLDGDDDSSFRAADTAAFWVVKAFYDIFGFADEAIPYVNRSGDRPSMDVALFGQ